MLNNFRATTEFGLPCKAAIKCDGAPDVPQDVLHHGVRTALRGAILHSDDEQFVHALADVLHRLDNLRAGTIGPDDWERARRAEAIFARWSRLTVAPFERKGTVIEQSGLCRPWLASFSVMGELSANGRTEVETVAWISANDSSEPVAFAALLLEVFADLSALLADSSPNVHHPDVVAGVNVIVDKNNVGLIQDSKRRWELREVILPGKITVEPPRLIYQDIIDARTGQRLEDLIMGCDGLFKRAFRRRSSDFAGVGGHDLRRVNVSVEDRIEPHTIHLPPEVWSSITAAAEEAGQDVGRYLAGRLSA